MTDLQFQVMNMILRLTTKLGYPPTLGEIGRALSWTNGKVSYQIYGDHRNRHRSLVDTGFLGKRGAHRSLEMLRLPYDVIWRQVDGKTVYVGPH